MPNSIVLERDQRTISVWATTPTENRKPTTDTFDINGTPVPQGVYRYERITQLTRIGD